MAHKWPSRVRETSTTTGTGTYSLGGAVATYRAVSAALEDGDTVDYLAKLGSDWELGRGTYSAGTLARTRIHLSSNSNAAVDWPAGTKDVYVIYPGISDLDSTGLANLSGQWGALSVTGSPDAGDYARFTGAAQVEPRTVAQVLSDLGAAAKSQTSAWHGNIRGTVANGAIVIVLRAERAGTITRVTTKAAAGTGTATWAIEGTNLGGSANALSTSEDSQTHSSDNVFAAGDTITVTIASASGLASVAFSVEYTETLA